MISFLDLQKVNSRFESCFQERFEKFLASGRYILGQEVAAFESRYADYCGVEHCIGVGSGLDALVLIFESLKNLGKLNAGDEVIVPANTFFASILAIIRADLTPVLVEPDPDRYTLSIENTQAHITLKTKAILAVHLYGQLTDMKALNALAQAHQLLVVEDAAQAHGATNTKGEKAGALAHAAAFSFYPSKNLGALADAGAVTTNDADLARMVKTLRNYGGEQKNAMTHCGFNSRLDEIQAVFLNIKQPYLDSDNAHRQRIAKRYCSNMTNRKIKCPQYTDNHVFHLFVVLVADRENFITYLNHHAIETAVHYPTAPHEQIALKQNATQHLPITEYLHRHAVSLPISPVMDDDDVRRVIEIVNLY